MDSFLVSVAVWTYNSSSTVIETLDSIYSQTYQNIELIISDDCSSDSTLEVCENWLKKHKDRFANSRLIRSSINTGTCANGNRAFKVCKGQWIKIIAADDVLAYNCIEQFVIYSEKYPNEHFFNCDLEVFSDNPDIDLQHNRELYIKYFESVKADFNTKKKDILNRCFFPAPGWFLKSSLVKNLEGFDETYRLVEEWPFVFKCLEHGVDIIPVPEKLVKYRVSNTSVSHSDNNSIVNNMWIYDTEKFIINKLFFRNIKEGNICFSLDHLATFCCLYVSKRYGNDSIIYKVTKLIYFISPYYYLHLFNKLRTIFASHK